jgi:hypothetical protein
MNGRGGVFADPKLVASKGWQQPMRDTDRQHVRFIWISRGGTGKQGGQGPTGYKLRPARLLARSLAERVGVAALVKQREEARVKQEQQRATK